MSEQDVAPVEEPTTPVEAPPADEPTPDQPAVDAAEDVDPPDVVEIPTGEKLVPLSALLAVRAELKSLKGQSAEVADLREKLAQTEGNLQQAAPYIEAARRMIEAQRAQQADSQQEQGPTAEELAELREIAQDFDFYRPDGSLDLDKAYRHQTRVAREADRRAQATVKPLVDQQMSARVELAKTRMKNTEVEGFKADPEILDMLARRLESQPGGLESLANEEAAKHVYVQALGLTVVKMLREGKSITPRQAKALERAAAGADTPPPPLYTERAGGKVGSGVALNDGDKRLAKDLGMSVSEYQKMVESMPAGWGGR